MLRVNTNKHFNPLNLRLLSLQMHSKRARQFTSCLQRDGLICIIKQTTASSFRTGRERRWWFSRSRVCVYILTHRLVLKRQQKPHQICQFHFWVSRAHVPTIFQSCSRTYTTSPTTGRDFPDRAVPKRAYVVSNTLNYSTTACISRNRTSCHRSC